MGRLLDPDTPLPQPTVRDLVPSYVWGKKIINLTQAEFDALPSVDNPGGRPDDFEYEIGKAYRFNSARYGETVGAWLLCRTLGFDRDCVCNEHLLIHINGKPVIEEFDDPYHDLSKSQVQ